METFQARSKWCEIFKVMKSKDLQLRLLYPARLSFKIKGEIRTFQDKKKLKEFVNTKAVLQQMLKGLLEERRRIVLGYTLNTQTLMKTDEPKKKF